MEVKVEGYGKMHIDAKANFVSSRNRVWRFTGFYGEVRRELRFQSWELLRLLKSKSDLPWLCAGDFNEVLQA